MARGGPGPGAVSALLRRPERRLFAAAQRPERAQQFEASIPVLMFCVACGLSMDYEVFMLARIKEEYERVGDTRRAGPPGSGRAPR
ncbi:MMPL family transporter [Streptomyces sp. NPDC055243]|uniref:MMPL family transporter n=1 Tax=Streptomyces sp. NPDC055243 TaxID=3365720 RepID=UPI0037D6FD13